MDLINKKSFQERFSHTDNKFAVAFSGGGDSTALLYWLIQNFGLANIYAVHFNHNLRQESDVEQSKLENFCDDLGVTFITEKWQSKPEGNIQQSARIARYKFLKNMCDKHDFSCVYTGHNKDDIAETFLMRLARGSGIKGLTAMAEITNIEGVDICRPLLSIGREEIREYLIKNNITWLDDPSNENDKFFRVRVRKHKKALEEIGIPFDSIVASSFSLQRAESLIESIASKYYQENITQKDGCLTCADNLLKEEDELILRMVDKLIASLTGEKMMPRTTKKQRLINHLKTSDKRYELGGVCFYKNKNYIFAKKV